MVAYTQEAKCEWVIAITRELNTTLFPRSTNFITFTIRINLLHHFSKKYYINNKIDHNRGQMSRDSRCIALLDSKRIYNECVS